MTFRGHNVDKGTALPTTKTEVHPNSKISLSPGYSPSKKDLGRRVREPLRTIELSLDHMSGRVVWPAQDGLGCGTLWQD